MINCVIIGHGAVGKTCTIILYTRQEYYNCLWPLSYQGVDVVVLAFSLVSRASYENILRKWIPELQQLRKWIPELQQLAPGIPVVMVGTKLDLREDNHYLANHPGLVPVTTAQNMKAVFDATIEAVIKPPQKQQMEKKKPH
ncbi:hypothetical protein ACH5RR_025629 [Cinchona calisaya]|uniref:Uncharacterized protein n=1 Tax=Cinchona calisaya TaxID=153742 RepID=A0ABD2Z467_9GENT